MAKQLPRQFPRQLQRLLQQHQRLLRVQEQQHAKLVMLWLAQVEVQLARAINVARTAIHALLHRQTLRVAQ